MKLLKLAIPFAASVLLFGCTSQSPQVQSSPTPTPSENLSTPATSSLQTAVEELEMLQTKVKSNIDTKAYSVLIANTAPIVQKASGDAKAMAAAKSALEGHQLALKYWQCSRLEGYEKLIQCRTKALPGIFAKYPNIAAQAQVADKSKDITTLSAELDEQEILNKIWEKTGADTEVARQSTFLDNSKKLSKP